jgi:hypothetical protein
VTDPIRVVVADERARSRPAARELREHIFTELQVADRAQPIVRPRDAGPGRPAHTAAGHDLTVDAHGAAPTP